uniref:Uncharacterized protein n=1 Tax=Paramoeba aestuarina TaxID=180227 RepID=A0A7S4NSP1_9EUKA
MLRRLHSLVPSTTRPYTRTYFYQNPGESGIWGATMAGYQRGLLCTLAFAACYSGYILFGPYNGGRQFAPYASDLYVSDGTEMDEEEAGAKSKIEYQRVMPLMKELKEKFVADGDEAEE